MTTSALRSPLPQNAVWEYRNYDMWKTLDDEVSRRLTDAFNEGRADTGVTMDEEYSYDFDLREMPVSEYRRALLCTYELRVIVVVRCGEGADQIRANHGCRT